MTDILECFGSVFAWLTSWDLFGVPYLYIVVGIALLGLIMSFIKGKKD